MPTLRNRDKKQKTMAENLDMSYNEAMQEINEILRSLRDGQNNVDTLAERVARATELIALCRAKLRKAESDVAKVLEE